MSQHVHYDLRQAEATMRRDFDALNATALPADLDEANRQFVRIQAALQEMQIQAGLWHLRMSNEGADPDMLATAMGHSIGAVLWSFASNEDDDPTELIGDIMDAAAETIMALRDRCEGEGSIIQTSTIKPVQGGRA